VLALGGGSALDAAKAIAALLGNGGDPLDYLEVVGRGQPLTRAGTPLIAIPTTAGTGSEVTKNAVLASPGASGSPITITADAGHERRALLRGDGRVPPLSLDGCQYWTIAGLRIESQDVADAVTTPDSGSVAVLLGATRSVTLSRTLLRLPNLHKHAHLLRVDDGASDVTVEECELLDFHHNAIEVARGGSIFVRRNYVNAHGVTGFTGEPGDDHSAGHWGVWLEETREVYAENNVVEGVDGQIGRADGL